MRGEHVCVADDHDGQAAHANTHPIMRIELPLQKNDLFWCDITKFVLSPDMITADISVLQNCVKL